MSTNSSTFDVIVIGVGGMGSAAVYELARSGKRVLGIEQFDVPHELGSSGGMTRIIRLAYWEHPGYVPLLIRAYELWRELEGRAGERLLTITGAVNAGPPGSDVFKGALNSSLQFDLVHEALTSEQISRRFPGYRLPAGHMGLFEPEGGFLRADRSIASFAGAALEHGAEIHGREKVLEWRAQGGRVTVRTDRGEYEAGALVVTSGAWSEKLVPQLAGLAVPERQVLGWFQPSRPSDFEPERFPVFVLEVDEGLFYGFPVHGVPGFKIGKFRHRRENTDADSLDREIHPEDEAVLREAVSKYFPSADGPVLSMKPCMFTNSPDDHFIIDRLPGQPEVTIAAGFSGHGFKFCSVVGEILAQLSTTGETRHPIEMFRLDRFAKA